MKPRHNVRKEENLSDAVLSMKPVEESTADVVHRTNALAIKLLARREHSESELRQKLRQKLPVDDISDEQIESVLGALIEAGYQSDRRFAELYAEQRKNRGYGPLAIRAKLGERGIEGPLASSVIAELGTDWAEHAMETLQRRFDHAELQDADQKTKARVARFLQTRGFSASDTHRALQLVS